MLRAIHTLRQLSLSTLVKHLAKNKERGLHGAHGNISCADISGIYTLQQPSLSTLVEHMAKNRERGLHGAHALRVHLRGGGVAGRPAAAVPAPRLDTADPPPLARRFQWRRRPPLAAAGRGQLLLLGEHGAQHDAGLVGELGEERHHLARTALGGLQAAVHGLQLLLHAPLLLAQPLHRLDGAPYLLPFLAQVPAAPGLLLLAHDQRQQLRLPAQERLVRELPPVRVNLPEALK
jgi:hypothetical protein